jgi:hypothetical protein
MDFTVRIFLEIYRPTYISWRIQEECNCILSQEYSKFSSTLRSYILNVCSHCTPVLCLIPVWVLNIWSTRVFTSIISVQSSWSVCALSATHSWTAWLQTHKKCQVIWWCSRRMLMSASVTSERDRDILVTGLNTDLTSTLPIFVEKQLYCRP